MKHCEGQAKTQSIDQLTQKNVETVLRLEDTTKSAATRADRISDAITRFCGSVWFVYLHILWFGMWLLMNVVLPKRFHFDAYPFSFLTLVVSLEAIFLSAFILISQNRQNILSERRAQLDLQINMLSEQENTAMLCLLQKIAAKVGVEGIRADKLGVLAQAVQPEQLARQIEETMRQSEKAA
jgi:uncharacterized membrane protein